MGARSLSELRSNLDVVVREVAYTGQEAIITDKGREVAVLISLEDYERLHEHADVVDAPRLRELRGTEWQATTLAEMLEELGVDAGDPRS